MNKQLFKKIYIIFNCIKEAPFSFLLIVSNFISSFLSIIGVPLLIFAYQFSQEQNKNDLLYYEWCEILDKIQNQISDTLKKLIS